MFFNLSVMCLALPCLALLRCLRNRGASHGRAGTLSVAETLRAGTVQGVSSPVLRSSASGVAGIFGGARKVEVRAPVNYADIPRGFVEGV